MIQNNNGAGGAGGGIPTRSETRRPVLKVEGGEEPHGEGRPAGHVDGARDRRRKAEGRGPCRRPQPAWHQCPRERPNRRPACGSPGSCTRGAGKVTFDPPQIEVWEDYREGVNSPWSAGWQTPTPPPDGKWVARDVRRARHLCAALSGA